MARFMRMSVPSRYSEMLNIRGGIIPATATNQGTALASDHVGRANSAISFNGSNSWVNLNNPNYQGDISWLCHVMLQTPDDAANIISKGFLNASNYLPNLRQMARTLGSAINTQSYNGSGTLTGPANISSAWSNNTWVVLGGGFKHGYKSFHYYQGGQIREDANAAINTNFATGYDIMLGRNEAGAYCSMTMSNFKLFSRYIGKQFCDKQRNYWRTH